MEEQASPVLKAASHTLIVQPSLASNAEHEMPSGLIVAMTPGTTLDSHMLMRGVVLDIGDHISEPNAEIGSVVHYSGYYAVGVGDDALHIVDAPMVKAFGG